MKTRLPVSHLATLFSSVALLAACGSSSDSAPPPPPAAAATLQGTAAVGAALGNADLAITDSTGAAACTQATMTTTPTGAYSCTLKTGSTAPFLIVVTDPSGANAPLVSVGSITPAAGTALTLNATPLTTAIVGQLVPNGDALAVVANPALINTTTLASIKAKVLGQLGDVLTAVGAPAGYDPFSTPIVAATAGVSGNTADQVVDLLKISVVNGVPTISTIDNPSGGVPLAKASDTAPPALPAPSAAVATLAEAVRRLTPALNTCFALPVTLRALATDTTIPAAQGGPAVTSLADACLGITHASYLHNGYQAGQAFYGLLTDDNMVGASFRPPEIMLFIDDTTADDHDRTVLNIRYTDKNGVAGNLITVAQKFPGSSTTEHPTDWWLYGNQQPVDSSIRAFTRRVEQFAPAPGTGVFVNAAASRYESGFNLFINKDGPGSTGLRAARVTGPGLPTAGVVLTRPDPAILTPVVPATLAGNLQWIALTPRHAALPEPGRRLGCRHGDDQPRLDGQPARRDHQRRGRLHQRQRPRGGPGSGRRGPRGHRRGGACPGGRRQLPGPEQRWHQLTQPAAALPHARRQLQGLDLALQLNARQALKETPGLQPGLGGAQKLSPCPSSVPNSASAARSAARAWPHARTNLRPWAGWPRCRGCASAPTGG